MIESNPVASNPVEPGDPGGADRPDGPADRAALADPPRRRYRGPSLVVLGDLRGLTLGGSDTQGDSGSGLRRNAVSGQRARGR